MLRGESFGGSLWKGASSPKVERFKKRIKLAAKEDAEKTKVRKRDKRCRFPLCGCGKMHLQLEVSHQTHKGAGGNPKGDRSTADRMVLVCRARHRELSISIDRGTLRWRALTKAGASGPIAWDVYRTSTPATLPHHLGLPPGAQFLNAGVKPMRWVNVANESAHGMLAPLTAVQQEILQQLAEMTL